MSHSRIQRKTFSPVSRWRAVVFVVTVFLVFPRAIIAGGGTLSLEWDRSADSTVVGYIIEWGESSSAYTNEVDVGNVTSYTIQDLEPGRTYYVIVRSYDSSGAESMPSNQAVGVAAGSSGGGGVPPAPTPDPDPDPGPGPGPDSGPGPGPGPDPGSPPPASDPGAPEVSSDSASPSDSDNPAPPVSLRVTSDFDADSRGDLALYRPTTGEWHVRGSTGLELYVSAPETGGIQVTPTPADYDGDGVTDIAWWVPAEGRWVIHASSNGFRWTRESFLGSAQSLPVQADYDGDGIAAVAVFEPGGLWTTETGMWQFGQDGDIPVPKDYDANGTVDMAVFRPLTGVWYIAGQAEVDFGAPGDVAVPADYDGDGVVDIAVYRPSTSTWYVRDQFTVTFGLPGDRPVPLDFDGDGRVEIVVYRPTEATWYVLNATTGLTDRIPYGRVGDVPADAPYFPVLGTESIIPTAPGNGSGASHEWNEHGRAPVPKWQEGPR